MATASTRQLKVLAFDVFGTVVDWRQGIIVELTAVARERGISVDSGAFADSWRRRAQQLWASVYRGERPYMVMDELHAIALNELSQSFGLQDLTRQDRERLVLGWHHLPAWPDALAGMTRLRSRFVLTTLSNGGMAHLVDVARSAGLPFDCILSTELVKTYKPDPRVYQMVPQLLKVRPEEAMMVASHPYDLSAAAEEGLRTAFVRRPREWGTGKIDGPDFAVDLTVDDLNDLATQLDAPAGRPREG
jgi:2-haloacid dehalogenase